MNPAIKLSKTARQAAVAKFRELADRLESGELRGARIQWRDGLDHVEIVEIDERPSYENGKLERRVRLYREDV